MTETSGLLDTSVIVAMEMLRPLDAALLPDRHYISVITLAELQAGILAATDTETRSRRIRTLASYSVTPALPAERLAAEHWARMRFRLSEVGRRININDLWIASIALAHDLPVITQDRDFDVIADLNGPEIIHV